MVQIESLNLHSDIYPEGLRNAHRHVADRWSSAQRTLVQHQHDLEEAFNSDMFGHVAENTYVNGLRLENAYPNLREYMREHYSPQGDDFVTMFGLKHLNLQDHAIEDVRFDVTLDAEFIESRTREYLSQAETYLTDAESNIQSARTELNQVMQQWEEFAQQQEALANGGAQLSAEYVVRSEQANAKTYYYGTVAGIALTSGLLASLAFIRKSVLGKKTEQDFDALL